MKKAQMRIFEVVAVVIIFFMLVALGLIYFGTTNQGGVEQERQKALELRALSIAEQVQNLPELQCSTNNVIVEKCFEDSKLSIVDGMIPRPDYFSSFGYSEIYTSEVPDVQHYIIYQNPKPDYKDKIVIRIPISVQEYYTTPAGPGQHHFFSTSSFEVLTVTVYD